MIQQTYYPFSGEDAIIPFHSIPTFSDPSPSLDGSVHREKSDSHWFSWVLLIIMLIGLAGVVYWWRSRTVEYL